ncbi:hypothetical protein [Nocardioides sp. 1609]|uniref:hypothetical protein n=1 Tax=Nocardioides sp. 1609 TaxID=2508327 RepID=UPI00106FE8B3|nr:hypothetical protein [Nocardioides sp. 1609]
MLILGLVVILVGAVLVVGGLFTTEVKGGDVEILGVGVSPSALFVVGLVAGLCILVGLWLTKWGTQRGLRQRKEQKKIDELSEKLDRADAGRRRDLDDDPDYRA